MSKIRCIFMASDPIAIPSLECVLNDHSSSLELVAVYTQPDRRSGRGKKLTSNPIKVWAEFKNIPVFQPAKMNADASEEFASLRADLVLVMAYGHILPKRILSLPSKGFYNLHASLLPKLRGASPIETAIVMGEVQTGVTLMQVVPALDAGPIVDAESSVIDPSTTAPHLRQQLAEACVPLLERCLPNIINDSITATPQQPETASYCRLIDKSDALLDFNLTTNEVLNHIRGFQPWPGAIFEIDKVSYRIGAAQAATHIPETTVDSDPTPGTIMSTKKTLFLATANGWIEVIELQKPGGKMLPIAQFLNGNPFKNGTKISFPERFPLIKNQYFRKPTPVAQ